MNGSEILVALAVKYEGSWDDIFLAIKRKEMLRQQDIDEIIKAIKSKYVTIIDPAYPRELKDIHKPPFVVFYYGNWDLAKDFRKNLAVVGSRKNSPYGERITRDIVMGLGKGTNVVSGMAGGIDSVAHQSAIDAGLGTIAVLGCGIDFCYPKSNVFLYERMKRDFLVVSEYPGDVQPSPDKFPVRNRIIAGLSWGVLITEASRRSGTMITANCALSIGREVMCVPCEAGKDSGANLLIKDGATLVESASDVLEQGVQRR